MTDYDQRQFRLIGDRLESFSNGNLSLNDLIVDLEALSDSLQAVDRPWQEAFQREWATLEEVYSVAADRAGGALWPEGKVLVDKSVETLRTLVNEKLD